MRVSRLDQYVGGWFIGDFEPTLHKTSSFEVCVKRYAKGSVEPLHHQLRAWEYTVILSGQARIGDITIGPDDILEVEPLEAASFEALDDVILVAIKVPSIPSDKVLGVPHEPK